MEPTATVDPVALKYYVATLSYDGSELIVSGDLKSRPVASSLDRAHKLRLTLQRGTKLPGLSWDEVADLLKDVGDISFGVEITCVD